MSARLLDGAAVARGIRAEVAPAVRAFTEASGRPPTLGLLLVGDDPASHVYVRNKVKAAAEAGIRVDSRQLSASTALSEVLATVEALNASDSHDGILVQSPLPPAMGPDAERRVFDAIDPAKDVDGFSPVNVGHLVQRRATLRACTPAGIIELLDRCEIPIAGARAVVVGRSDIVGKPMALMLMHRDATVTVCHSRTQRLAAVCAEADLLVAAIGRACYITADFVRPGATVIDVGMNRLDDADAVAGIFAPGSPRREQFERTGSVLVGDVHPEVAAVAGALTPVPGGVGPLTIAMLMKNTLAAAVARRGRPGVH